MTDLPASNFQDLAALMGEDLVRAPGRGKLHLRLCAHLQDTREVSVASAHEVASAEVCTSCAAELNGQGRRYFDSLDNALEVFGMPLALRSSVHEMLAHVTPERIWIPNSGSYVALGRAGVSAVYVGKSYVYDGETIPLPGYSPSFGGSGGAGSGERPTTSCPTCGLELPLTGVCDEC